MSTWRRYAAVVFFSQHSIMDRDHFASCFQGLSKIIEIIIQDTDRPVSMLHILWFRAFQKMLEALHKRFGHNQATSGDIVREIENPQTNQTDLLFIGAAMHILRDKNKNLLQEWNVYVDRREHIVYEKWLGYSFNNKLTISQRFYEIVKSVIEKQSSVESNVWAQLARRKIESDIPPPPPLPKPIPPTFDPSPPPPTLSLHTHRSETALLHTQLVNQLLNFSTYGSLETMSIMDITAPQGSLSPPQGPLSLPQGPLLQWSKNIANTAKLTDTLFRRRLLKRIEKHSLIEREFETFLIDVQETVKGLQANNFVVKKLFSQILQRNDKQKSLGEDKWKDLITESMIQDFVNMSEDNVTKLGAAAASFIQNEPVSGVGALVSFTLGNIYKKSDEAALSAIFSAAAAAAKHANPLHVNYSQ